MMLNKLQDMCLAAPIDGLQLRRTDQNITRNDHHVFAGLLCVAQSSATCVYALAGL